MAAAAYYPNPRVLLADDHQSILETASRILEPCFDVVAVANDGESALQIAARTNPDLIVLDVTMPGVDGFQVARELKQRPSCPRVVFLTGHEDDAYIAEGLDAGAMAYVVKRRMRSDLIPALTLAQAGRFFISPHAFAGTQDTGTSHHVLVWYFHEDAFLQRISELAYVALLENDRVVMFLTQKGLGVVGMNLRARGLDLTKHILLGRYRSFGIENVLPVLMRGGRSTREVLKDSSAALSTKRPFAPRKKALNLASFQT